MRVYNNETKQLDEGDPKPNAIVGYALCRHGSNAWCFLGVDPRDVADGIRSEIEMDFELPGDERDTMTVEPVSITQEEVDRMPEFPGW